MLKHKIIIGCFFFSVCCFAANINSPLNILQSMSDSLLSQLVAIKNISSDSHSNIVNIIKNTLLPKIDEVEMSRMVIGPIYWRSSSAQTKKDFTNEFMKMVTNNYARIFAVYSDQKVNILPSRVDYSTVSRVEMKSIVASSKGADFKVSYKMQKNTIGEWMIYDFTIDGISMTESYKAQFAPTLANEGLQGIVSDIKSYNNRHKQ